MSNLGTSTNTGSTGGTTGGTGTSSSGDLQNCISNAGVDRKKMQDCVNKFGTGGTGSTSTSSVTLSVGPPPSSADLIKIKSCLSNLGASDIKDKTEGNFTSFTMNVSGNPDMPKLQACLRPNRG